MKREQRTVLCMGANSTRSQPRAFSAFSLIELLVVMLIIVLLTGLYWGGKAGDAERSKLAACQQNLQKLFISMQIYANENHDSFPQQPGARSSEEALDKLVPKYTADTSLFICPASGDQPLPGGESILKHRISYAYYMGRTPGDAQAVVITDEQANTQSKNPGQQIFSNSGKPPGNNHKKYGGNFLFSDGHVDSSVPNAAFSLVLTQGVQLLNPLPK
jgi:prepilin-type N-terminal cleavage/methylation domain-containing protein/prepilin-type processing-associated H-X9-DG protein